MSDLTLSEVARQIDVPEATLRRWVKEGIVPTENGGWSPPAVAQARIVARLRERGHTMKQLREAAKSGRLAFGYIEDLFPDREGRHTLDDAAEETGLEPALIERIWTAIGVSTHELESLSDDDL